MAGQEQVPSRQAASRAWVPMVVPAVNVNKVCLSGLKRDLPGRPDDRRGRSRNRGRCRHRVDDQRPVPRRGGAHRVPLRQHGTAGLDRRRWPVVRLRRLSDGPRNRALLGGFAEPGGPGRAGGSRHERAAAAIKEGRLADEIVPVTAPGRRGDPAVVEHDEGVRPETTVGSLGELRAAFDPEGTVTAGNASQLSDGASVIGPDVEGGGRASRGHAARRVRLLRHGGRSNSASLLHQPTAAIEAALNRTNLRVDDVDLFEINEAFAAVALASMDDLELPADVVERQRWGDRPRTPDRHERQSPGPDAASRAASPRRGTGAAALCGGGGQGDALVVRTVT